MKHNIEKQQTSNKTTNSFNARKVLSKVLNLIAAIVLLTGTNSFSLINYDVKVMNDSNKIEKKKSVILNDDKGSVKLALPTKSTVVKGDYEIQLNMQKHIREYLNPMLNMPEMVEGDFSISNQFYNQYLLTFEHAAIVDADDEINFQFFLVEMGLNQALTYQTADNQVNENFYLNKYIPMNKHTISHSDCAVTSSFKTENAG
jgi:hypothetical protein